MCNKFFKVTIFFLFIFIILPIFPHELRELIPSGNSIYDDLTSISLDSGHSFLMNNTPLTVSQIKSFLDELDYNELSVNAQKSYDKIINSLDNDNISFSTDSITISVQPELTLEGYYKQEDTNWIYDRYEKKPLINVPITFSLSDYISMYSGLNFSINKQTKISDSNFMNIPTKATQIDIHFPSETYISTGFNFSDTSGVSFICGTIPRSIGRTLTGSCILSNKLTGVTYAQLSLYSPNIKWTSDVMEVNVDRYLYTHRLELRLFNKLNITLHEGTFINAPLELRFLNPFTIFHSFAQWRDYGSDDAKANETFGISLDFIPFRYTRLYGLFILDQFQTNYERTNYPDSVIPNGLGGQIGAEVYLPVKKGYLHTVAEFTYTMPCLYISESPNWSYVRTYSENIGDPDYAFYEWIGTPFGPDTMVTQLTIEYDSQSNWSTGITYQFQVKGKNSERNIFEDINWGGTNFDFDAEDDANNWAFPTNTDQRDENTPSGSCPVYINKFSIRGTLNITNYLSLLLQPGYSIIFNNNHNSGETLCGFEAAISVTCNFSNLFHK